jgi:hypothetical protein
MYFVSASATPHCQLYKNSVAQQCLYGKSVASNNETYVYFNVKWRCCTKIKETSFARGLPQSYNFAEQIVVIDMSLRSVPVFVSVAVNKFTRSDVIHHLQSNGY